MKGDRLKEMGGRRDNAFLSGDIVYLRLPDIEKDVKQGAWTSWFNDLKVTRYLEHGIFPVSNSQECKIVEEDISDAKPVYIPYAFKLLMQELMAIGIIPRLVTN